MYQDYLANQKNLHCNVVLGRSLCSLAYMLAYRVRENSSDQLDTRQNNFQIRYNNKVETDRNE